LVTREDYPGDNVAACFQVLIELMTLLGDYRDSAVVVGGWVPFLYVSGLPDAHVGTTDIDLALDPEKISEDAYATLLRLLTDAGYEQDTSAPASYRRRIKLENGIEVTVRVDLLSGQYGGTTKGHRHQRIQDLLARKIRGCDLVFLDNLSTNIEGVMPDGSRNSVRIKIAGILPFLVMKGMALYSRSKEKDAYDICYVIKHFPGGLDAIAGAAEELRNHPLVLEGLGKIRAKFATIDSIGPVWNVKFLQIEDEEEAFERRDAFERVNRLLDLLEIEPFEETD